jgi:3-hydroxypropanoate dehydrogenase
MTTMLDRLPGSDFSIDARSVDLIFRDARTAYSFTDESVTGEQLDRIRDLVRFPPTAMNTQPLRVVLVTSPEAKARLLPHLADGNRAKATSAPVVAILAADTNFHEFLPRVLPHAPGARGMFADDAKREESARFNATLQAGYFILAVRAAGLAAGPMGGFDAAGVDRDLLGDGSLRSLLIVNIGHAAVDGTRPRSPRLDDNEVFSTL